QGAYFLGCDLAALEKDQRGDTADAVFCRRSGIGVDVELGDRDTAGIIFGDLVEDRGDHLAGPAPFGPVIDEYRRTGFQDVGVKARVGHVLDVLAPPSFSGLSRGLRRLECGSRTRGEIYVSRKVWRLQAIAKAIQRRPTGQTTPMRGGCLCQPARDRCGGEFAKITLVAGSEAEG